MYEHLTSDWVLDYKTRIWASHIEPGLIDWQEEQNITCITSSRPIMISLDVQICDEIWENPSDVTKCKIELVVSFKAASELFPELFKSCLHDIHIQSCD